MSQRVGRFGRLAVAGVCLGFTGAAIRAESAHADARDDAPPPTVEETMAATMHARGPSEDAQTDAASLFDALDDAGPAAPYVAPAEAAAYGRPPARLMPPPPVGPTARLGTSVGYVYNNPLDVLALGGQVSGGYRFDRVVAEVEYAYYRFQSHGAFPIEVGHANRLGVLGRVDVLRSRPGSLGRNSSLAGYAELGAARQANVWDRPKAWEAARDVPANTTHTEGTIGFGLRIDHGTRYPIGFPHRIGWMLGWRLVAAPHDPVAMSLCRGEVACVQKPTPMAPPSTEYGTALLFQSSLEATW
jgi:hypothetical protein